MDSDSKISLIGIFIVCFIEDYGRGNQFGKVVHDKSGKDFLVNVLHFFSVKMQQANCVFELPERGFNAPAHSIELLEFMGREISGIQIGNHGFKGIICDFEAHDSEEEIVKHRWIMLAVLFGKEVKTLAGRNRSIYFGVTTDYLLGRSNQGGPMD